MAAASAVTSSSISTSLRRIRRNSSFRFSKVLLSASPSCGSSPERPPEAVRSNYTGIRLAETVELGFERTRVDSWISSRIPGISRARVQSSIRTGLVTVNGRIIDKVSHILKGGDKVSCVVCELEPLKAEPEEIPLNIVYEDEHVLVVNKPAHMVVHPAPGNANGTLVNAILNHCQLPAGACINRKGSSETDNTDSSENEVGDFYVGHSYEELKTSSSDELVRPGIVHRLDKGTSGLLVVAKDEHSHAHLAKQFKLHTIHRQYVSLVSGVPSPSSGRIAIPIVRDCNNRTRMATVSGINSSRNARNASSRYKVVEVFAAGGSALVQWRLETGRTHQIRTHAKYLGIPLLGDELYGGTKGLALSLLKSRTPMSCHALVSDMVSKLQRPCLHAQSLGFKHPHTGEHLHFSCPPPDDFTEILHQLRTISDHKSQNDHRLEL
ncbi:RNA pseudouridine synthase 2, chloroplastic-like isoform X1 [Dendrobium catenatum]|uniref:RNA pseudouridine synthase 2, chloroplastic-like isoform X1 n=1 Tax=Dendrobium catenatum TaxID=906689 RepID=UPI0009F43C66|nr:RNA pseudouridine synthase 2, chloroplastic-like isoform X1 [Dendrobium catenatum]